VMRQFRDSYSPSGRSVAAHRSLAEQGAIGEVVRLWRDGGVLTVRHSVNLNFLLMVGRRDYGLMKPRSVLYRLFSSTTTPSISSLGLSITTSTWCGLRPSVPPKEGS